MKQPKLFVGNIAWAASLQELKDLFSKFGTVVSAVILSDKTTGKSKGCGFVEMTTIEEAEKLVELWIVEGAGIIFNAFTEKRYPEFLETLTVSVYCEKNDYIRPGYLEDILITFIANDVKYKFNSYLKSTHNYQYTIDGRY